MKKSKAIDRTTGPKQYLAGVRQQYEFLPFPRRDPEDERRMLVVSPVDILAKVNHYCFQGRQNFGSGFRALVAGGGTGDSAIFLAQQLKERDAEVVYLDVSSASMEIAQRRAGIRGLENIRWIHGSILDIPRLKLGEFSYINCLGVLHHLKNPRAGLKALSSVLADDGAMALMLYGKYGRAHIYQMQHLMRMINAGDSDVAVQIENAKAVLGRLPPTNLFRRTEGDQVLRDWCTTEHALLYDDLMNVQDRPYTASEVHEFLEAGRLKLVQFTTYQGVKATCRTQYDPALYIQDASVLAKLRKMDLRLQQDVAEIIDGSLSLHTFYAARSTGTIADFGTGMGIPSFMTSHAVDAARLLSSSPATEITVLLRNGYDLSYRPGPLVRAFLGLIDGARPVNEILDLLAQSPSFAPLLADRRAVAKDLAHDLDLMFALNWILLRQRGAAQFKPIWMPPLTLPHAYEEPSCIVNAALGEGF